jgi:hypothetical protein
MIRRQKVRYDNYSLISAFSEKPIYFTYKRYNLTRKRLILLLQCYEYQNQTNRLLTANALLRFAPYSCNEVYRNVRYLCNRDILELVNDYKNRDSKGTHRNKYYNVSKKGMEIINSLNTLIGIEINKFRELTPAFKTHTPQMNNYFEELGILNAKKSKNRNDDGPTADG